MPASTWLCFHRLTRLALYESKRSSPCIETEKNVKARHNIRIGVMVNIQDSHSWAQGVR